MKKIGICGGPSTGKAQPLSALILTPNGWKTMEEIKAGDTVVTPKGKQAKVLGVFPQGSKEIYTITFHDGSQAECCLEHLWECYYVEGYKKYTRAATKHVVNTGELINLIKEQRERKSGSKTVTIPMIEPLAADNIDLPIAPYLLGVLLGDGSIRRATPRVASIDEAVVKKVQNNLPEGLSIKKIANSQKEYQISQDSPINKGGSVGMLENPLVTKLKETSVWGCRSFEKFIPEEYKGGSIKQRLELLQGLLDTDGTVGKSADISFSTTSLQLAKDVQEIIWSLGGCATIATRHPSYTYKGKKLKGRPAYNVFISYLRPRDLFSLERKQDRCPEIYTNGRRPLRRRIVSIEYKSIEDAQCILIDDPEHLYVTNDYVVTHNTTIARALVNRLNLADYNAEYVTEYARYHINMCKQHNVPDRDPLHQAVILHNQLKIENSVPEEVEFMITDSAVVMHPVYGWMLSDHNNYNHRQFFLQMYEEIISQRDRYEHILFVPQNIPYKADGTRSEDLEKAKDISNRIHAFLTFHGYTFYEVKSVNLDDRVEECFEVITH